MKASVHTHPKTTFPLLLAILLCKTAMATHTTVVLTFEDLPNAYGSELPTHYGGLTWDDYVDYMNPILSRFWVWKSESTSPSYSQPHSGENYVHASYGNNNLGFSLPQPTDGLVGAWFAEANAPETAEKVRFNGFDPAHVLVQQNTGDCQPIRPQYLAANFSPVARIEVETSNLWGHVRFG